MGAAFCYRALTQHGDDVRVSDGGQPVCDDKAGASFHQPKHGGLDTAFGAGVHIGGRFVQNEHRRVQQHGPCDGEQLALALGDAVAAVPQHGVVALGQRFYKAVDLGGPRCSAHLLQRHTLLAVGKVFVYGARKQPGVLQHHGIGAAQAGAGEGKDLLSVHGDGTGICIVKAHQQVDDSGFARARRPHYGNHLAGLRGQREAVQHRSAAVAEAHAAQCHCAAHTGKLPCAGSIRGLLCFIQQLEHALGGSQRGLQLADDVGKFVDGTGKFAGIQYERGHAAQADAARHVQQRAEQAHQCQRQIIDEVDARPGRTGKGVRLIVGVAGEAVLFLKTGKKHLLPSIGLDGFQPARHFLGKAVQSAQTGRAAAVQRPHPFGTVSCKHHGNGNGHNENKDQLRRDGEHHSKGTGHGDDAGEHLYQVVGKGGVDGVHVVGEHAQYVADGMRIEKAHRQAHQMVIDVLAHAVNNVAAQSHHQRGQHIAQRRCGKIKHKHPFCIVENRVEVHSARPGADGVDGVARKLRACQSKASRLPVRLSATAAASSHL